MGQDISVNIEHRGRYYHEKSMGIVLEYSREEPQDLYEFIESEIEELSIRYYRQLEDLYYDLISDERVKEALSC